MFAAEGRGRPVTQFEAPDDEFWSTLGQYTPEPKKKKKKAEL